MFMRCLGVLAVGLLLLNATAVAQDLDNKIEFGGGIGFPTSANDFDDTADPGPAGRLGYFRQVSERFSIGGRFTGMTFSGNERVLPSTLGGQLTVESDTDVMTLEVVAKLALRPGSRF